MVNANWLANASSDMEEQYGSNANAQEFQKYVVFFKNFFIPL